MGTISLELAKKIHEAAKEKGVELCPSSKNVWAVNVKSKETYLCPKQKIPSGGKYSFFHAYGTDELLEILPGEIDGEHGFIFEPTLIKEPKGRNGYSASYYCLYGDYDLDYSHVGLHKTPSEALGQMLLCLIENDLYTNQS